MLCCKDSWSVVIATLALLVYGVLQERVMTRSYGDGALREVFPHSAFLVLCNRLLTVMALAVHSHFAGLSFKPVAPVHAYCAVSASNMLSTLCQYEALKYVSFVTQTLAKTSKALPVVIWGTVVGRKRYKAEQYVHAILITAGCSVFVLGGDISSTVAAPGGSWWTYCVGMCLLLVYLAADGWTSTQQEHLFKAYGTCVREQLLYTTAFSAVYSLCATVAGGQLLPAIGFLFRHPSAAWAVLGLSVMSTIIQVCISHVLQQHGALVFALMMTTRQCASVLLSSLLFGHALSMSQWLGVVVVFSALYHQKSSKLVSSRRSAGGRLPQSRQSAGGAHHVVPLLAKQASVQSGIAATGRGTSLAGTPAAVTGSSLHQVKHAAAASQGGAKAGSVAGGPANQGQLTLPMKALQSSGGVAGAVQQSLTPRLHAQQHARGQGLHGSPSDSLPPSPRAAGQPPALLLPQLSLPSGLKKLWGQGDAHHYTPAGAEEREEHTE